MAAVSFSLFCWFAFGVSFGPLRLAFVLLIPAVGGFVYPYFWFALGIGFWPCAAVSFYFSFVWRLVLVGPGQELGNLRCELFVFK